MMMNNEIAEGVVNEVNDTSRPLGDWTFGHASHVPVDRFLLRTWNGK